MSKPTPHPSPQPVGADKQPPRTSGRVQFDERGQAVWEWAVQTGMFDRNASTQRVRALSESAMKLEIEEEPAAKPANAVAAPRRGDAITPYDRPEPKAIPAPASAKPAPAPRRGEALTPYDRPAPKSVPAPAPAKPSPAPRLRDAAGSDPYSSGPAKRPESMNFNPYERTSPHKR